MEPSFLCTIKTFPELSKWIRMNSVTCESCLRRNRHPRTNGFSVFGFDCCFFLWEAKGPTHLLERLFYVAALNTWAQSRFEFAFANRHRIRWNAILEPSFLSMFVFAFETHLKKDLAVVDVNNLLTNSETRFVGVLERPIGHIWSFITQIFLPMRCENISGMYERAPGF